MNFPEEKVECKLREPSNMKTVLSVTWVLRF